MNNESAPMHIIHLEAEAFKRLRAVRISPNETGLVKITGRNAQGKSSVLDAIMAALGGKRNAPDKPVRKGAQSAEIRLTLSDGVSNLLVRRRFTAGGSSSIEVTPDGGQPIASPQEALNRLLGALSFDPLAFTRMEPRNQVEALKSIAGLSDRFETLEREKADVAARLTQARRDEKQAEAVLAATPLVPGPDAESSVGALLAELNAATEKASEIRRAREWLGTMRKSLARNADEIASVESQIKALNDRLSVLHDAGRQMQAQIDGNAARVEAMQEPDTTGIRDRINSIESDNAAARKRVAHREADKRRKAAEDDVRRLSRQAEEISIAKADMLADANLPVKGLGFDEAGVTLNGLPFAQASQAERLRASFAIAMATKPTVRVALIHDGSCLDADGLRLLAEIAGEYDAQVWVELVSDGQNVGIVIEDGEVASVEEGAMIGGAE